MGVVTIIWVLSGTMMCGLAYLIHNKKQYYWLSGYGSYTELEKEELERNGYYKVVGRYMWRLAILWVISIPFVGFGVPYSLEVFMPIFLVYYLAGALYVAKHDIKRKRKQSIIILSVTAVITVGGLGILWKQGSQATKVNITAEEIQLSGMYDDTILIKDIQTIELTDTLPDDTIKANGFATETRSLGSFRSNELGPGRHHVFTKYPPYIFVRTEDRYYLINSENEEETEKWFTQINDSINRLP